MQLVSVFAIVSSSLHRLARRSSIGIVDSSVNDRVAS
jgi:hypothetical protein